MIAIETLVSFARNIGNLVCIIIIKYLEYRSEEAIFPASHFLVDQVMSLSPISTKLSEAALQMHLKMLSLSQVTFYYS
jgi:hypothetical protein